MIDDMRRIADAVIAGLIVRLIGSAIDKLPERKGEPKHERKDN